MKMAISELADVSERRSERLINPALSEGLPGFLTKHGGVCSGFMIAQYAAASMVSELSLIHMKKRIGRFSFLRLFGMKTGRISCITPQ